MPQTITINNVPDIIAHRLGGDTSRKGVTSDQNGAYLLAKALNDTADASTLAPAVNNSDKWTKF